VPRRNRVTPLGEIVAHPARGLVFGNRGSLHDDDGRIRRTHAGRRWIACRLDFNDRRRDLMQPGRYTELFFLDDATALAAGHRPCAECRREDFSRFVEHWASAPPRAAALDDLLHAERLTDAGRQRHHDAALDELPEGAFIVRDDMPWLVRGDKLARWTPAGYTNTIRRPVGTRARVVTPPALVAVLRRGWWPTAVPLFHPSAPGPAQATPGS
jgi:hypothetical protein